MKNFVAKNSKRQIDGISFLCRVLFLIILSGLSISLFVSWFKYVPKIEIILFTITH
jgi:hypothetical protein